MSDAQQFLHSVPDVATAHNRITAGMPGAVAGRKIKFFRGCNHAQGCHLCVGGPVSHWVRRGCVPTIIVSHHCLIWVPHRGMDLSPFPRSSRMWLSASLSSCTRNSICRGPAPSIICLRPPRKCVGELELTFLLSIQRCKREGYLARLQDRCSDVVNY